MFRKMFWFLAFVTTGVGLLVNSFMEASGINMSTFLLIIISLFYLLGIKAHLKELQGKED